MKHRNSPARAAMLADRAQEQRLRGETPSKGQGVPASINRRTGKPHEHNRAKARRLSQVARQHAKAWGIAWAASA